MAIMKRCCCFNDTRSGSMASAIYSLIYAVIFCALSGAGFALLNLLGGIVLVMYYLSFVVYGLVFVCSIIGIVGVSKDSAGLIIPYIVAVLVMMIVELASYIVWLSVLGFAAILLIIPFVIWLLLLALNIMCLLCAISQYQELKAGRGTVQDIQAANTTTTVIMTGGPVITQQAPAGTFIVQQPPPAYGQPMIQQGYAQPPPQTGYAYPPPQQPILNQPDDGFKA
ncbi:uncharacterized protein LOC119727492 [Patiria miniata]|uniref:Uncharacterized protein n=1 Tax=Patiria miniata TaxID=46514 RepID=A0A913ZUB3_PATMI|nr:uncharacterized protein LOC119727492 [Patiria miniata]